MHLAPLIYLANSEPTAEVKAKMLQAFGNGDANLLATLSPEQRDVLELVVQGVPNKLIAKQLNVSIRAVEDRRARVMRSLGAKSLAELIKRAITAGM